MVQQEAGLIELEVFGSDCYENIPKIKRRKWDKRSEERIFVGYQGNNNFRIYDPIKRKVGVATIVTFSRKQGDFRFSKLKSVTEVDSDQEILASQTTWKKLLKMEPMK